MIKLPNLTEIDLTRFDVRNMGLPSFDPKSVSLPEFDLPKFELPFELPKMDLPKMDLPKFDIDGERVAGLARDAAYVGIGAVVVTAQKADERRRELTDQVTAGMRKLVDSVA